MLLALGHDRHDRVLVTRGHLSAGRCQSGRHDVRTAQHELDRTLVDLLDRQQEGIFQFRYFQVLASFFSTIKI